MRIGLIDVDGHNFPNLALMRISAYHKSIWDTVEWWQTDFIYYDRICMSKIFSDAYSPDVQTPVNCGEIIKGGNTEKGGTQMNETEALREMLKKALDEMNPRCQYCIHVRDRMLCVNECKWRHEEEARALIGEKEAEHEV